jgi:hypothetical protein
MELEMLIFFHFLKKDRSNFNHCSLFTTMWTIPVNSESQAGYSVHRHQSTQNPISCICRFDGPIGRAECGCKPPIRTMNDSISSEIVTVSVGPCWSMISINLKGNTGEAFRSQCILVYNLIGNRDSHIQPKPRRLLDSVGRFQELFAVVHERGASQIEIIIIRIENRDSSRRSNLA